MHQNPTMISLFWSIVVCTSPRKPQQNNTINWIQLRTHQGYMYMGGLDFL